MHYIGAGAIIITVISIILFSGFPAQDASLIDDDAIKGDPDAPVTIVEWSDFECPFCQRFYKETLPLIEEKYIKKGKVKFVFRDFPLNFHKNAQKAAEAAECAGEQGKFWEMHDKLFEEGVKGGVASFKKYAREIGLDAGEFDKCLDSGKMSPEVLNDKSQGKFKGVSSTPTFFINGRMLTGAKSFSVFSKIIEEELARTK